MNLKRVTAEEAKRMSDQEGYAILDVRSMPEFQAEHPAGAFNVPFLHKAPHGMVPNGDFAQVVQAAFPDKAAKLIVTCQMGGRSVRATAELMNLGYTQVVDLRGGFGSERDDFGKVVVKGWKDLGLPISSGDPEGKSYRELSAKVKQPEAPPAAASSGAHAHGPLSRFADPNHMVDCVKLGRRLPGIKRRPFPGPLGEKIRANVSADAWEMWTEHAKMIINEYRINSTDPRAQELLMAQCEQFFWGEGSKLPEGYVPKAGGHSHSH